MKFQQNKQRNAWTKQEDECLIYLKEGLKLKKWTEISKKLRQMHNFYERNDKHCRDRYENFLKRDFPKKSWTTQNEKQLIELYIQYGNKWTELSTYFDGINGVYLKNKFYSRLRKGIRNINCSIYSDFQKKWKQLKFDVIFKLVNCASNKYDLSSRNAIGRKIEESDSFVQQIIYKIFMISYVDKMKMKIGPKIFNSNSLDREDIEKLIEQINFIDENMDNKRSNKIKSVEKEKYQKKSNQYLIKTSYQIKIQQVSPRVNEDHENYRNQQNLLQFNSLMQNANKKKIEIISTNLFQQFSNNWKTTFFRRQEILSLQQIKKMNNDQSVNEKSKTYCTYRQISCCIQQLPDRMKVGQLNLNSFVKQQIQEKQDKENNLTFKVIIS